MSKPVGEEQVVPTTFFKDSLASRPLDDWDRLGEREGGWRKGEFEGVSFSRFDGVQAILTPLKCGNMCARFGKVQRAIFEGGGYGWVEFGLWKEHRENC